MGLKPGLELPVPVPMSVGEEVAITDSGVLPTSGAPSPAPAPAPTPPHQQIPDSGLGASEKSRILSKKNSNSLSRLPSKGIYI